MNQDNLVEMIMAKPAFRNIKIEEGQRKKTIIAFISAAINSIAVRYDFPFAVGRKSEVTSANQSEYECNGNSDDCRDIIDIRYDTDLLILENWNQIDLDIKLSEIEYPTSVLAWVKEGEKNGTPVIKLIGTPTEDGITFIYRFRRKNVTVAEYPEEWANVLINAVMMILADAYKTEDGQMILGNFESAFERGLNRMINNYDKGGATPKIVRMNDFDKQRNIERNRLHGYS